MKKLSVDKLVETIHTLRKEKGLTQAQLADATGINRAMIGRIENKDYIPTVEQMQTLGEVLGFEVVDMFVCDEKSDAHTTVDKSYNIAVAGTGYVGLSLATLGEEIPGEDIRICEQWIIQSEWLLYNEYKGSLF